MSDEAGTETDVTDAGAATPATKHIAHRAPFLDGLAPILLGLVWLVGARSVDLFAGSVLPALGAAGAVLLIEETRSVVMSEAGAAVLLFAGFVRAAAPLAVGREQLVLRGLGKVGFALLLLSLCGWIALSLSFLIPGVWPGPFGSGDGAAPTPGVPSAVYWADFAILATLYGALAVFAAQILATLVVGARGDGGRVGPAALAFAVASLIALFALPDDLRHSWLDLTAPSAAVGVEAEDGLAAKAYARRDGRYYVYDQIKLTALDFVAIAAAFGLLCIAVWRGAGGALRWSWLASVGVLIFAFGAWFTLSNIGLASPNAMARALTTATILCAVALLALPIAWIRTLLAKGARRGAPAFWAIAALVPTSVAIVVVPLLASHLELARDSFDFWIAAFDSLDAMLLLFAGFAGWYALQHRLTGRETGRFWSVAHLAIAFVVSAGAAFGAFYTVYLEGAVQLATGALPSAQQAYAVWGIILAEYVVFLLGLALARRRSVSRFEPASSEALGAASRAASAAKPKETFERTTLFEDGAKSEEEAGPAATSATDQEEPSAETVTTEGVASAAATGAPMEPTATPTETGVVGDDVGAGERPVEDGDAAAKKTTD